MTPNYQKLKETLQEVFMLDKAELDFGIYRIMNQKRKEIEDFLERDLLPQVKAILEENQSNERKGLETELAEKVSQIKALGYNPDENPAVLQLKESLTRYGNMDALEDSVFSHLATFFKRYYDNGDFISMRRYKKDVYAIPYEGEEVKLHWANADQYYIKTSEYLKNYSFTLADGRKVLFELVEASTEQNNNKSQSDKERRFRLAGLEALETYKVLNPDAEISDTKSYRFSEKELSIFFTYELADKKVKQTDLIDEALETLKNTLPTEWKADLLAPVGTRKKGGKEVPYLKLEKHLVDYAARNTFDYFIHKDLGCFLRRELDFYIKNEVLFIDDINTRSEKEFVSQLSRLKAIKKIGEKIIAFLAQLEDFQKKLWLKKKMVVDAQYCITLDRVPEEFYPEIAANVAQREEWVKLFAIDEITQDLTREGYSQPLSVRFLKENPFLVLDTAFFSEEFTEKLLANLDNLDEQTDGLLVNSENFQALKLLENLHQGSIDCIYIDPPYNTGGDDFIYKDDFQHSSWLSMMIDRLQLGKNYLAKGGSFSMSIDLKELDKSISILDSVFGEENRKSCSTVKRGSVTGAKVFNPGVVNVSEYVLTYSSNSAQWTPERAFREKGYDSRYGNIITNPDSHFQFWTFESVLEAFARKIGTKKSKLKALLGDEYDQSLLDFVINEAARIVQFASLDENSISEEAVALKLKSLEEPGKIFHLARGDKNDYYILKGKVILFYKDRLIEIGGKLVPSEPISDNWDDVLPNDLHNEGGVSLRKGKKPEKLLARVIGMSGKPGSKVLDFFAGSGTASATAQKTNRKWIGVEQATYFKDITMKRMKNTLFGDSSGVSKDFNWKGGGSFKYLRLESYEDTLNNLVLQRSPSQQLTLESSAQFKEGYMLGYMMDIESRGSLLNLEWFKDPFNVHLNITQNNETKPSKINLVETFNYLIGLVVNSVYTATVKGCKYKIVNGTTRAGEKTLVIWRQVSAFASQEEANLALNDFMKKSDYRPLDREFDRIWVNGDNNVENLKIGEERWKVGLIEEEFGKRMFEEK